MRRHRPLGAVPLILQPVPRRRPCSRRSVQRLCPGRLRSAGAGLVALDAPAYIAAGGGQSVNRTIGGTGTAVTTSLAYDAADRLTTLTHQVAGGSILATYLYQYDPGDRLTHETNNDGGYTYTYDNNNELTGVAGTHGETYTYDSTGNRTMTGYTTGTANETTASPNTTYAYDAEGNLTSKTNTSTHVTTSYSYDYRDRLTTVSVGGTVTATYTYDALNRRIGTDLSGTQTWTVYDGNTPDDSPYADFNSSGTLDARYLSGPAVDELLARTSSGGTTAWYLTDKLGSVRDIASSSGTVIDHVVYDTFGNIVTETNSANGDRFKFTGMEYDAAIGLYYDHARFYDPAAGRFIKQDPLGMAAGDPNLYRYVGNSPTNGTDPSGMAAIYNPSVDPVDSPPSAPPYQGGAPLWPLWEGLKAGAGNLWDNTFGGPVNDANRVWSNTAGQGFSTLGRIYTVRRNGLGIGHRGTTGLGRWCGP